MSEGAPRSRALQFLFEEHVNLLVEARASVVSAGTERMLVEFGRSNLLGKARGQPDKVKQVLEKVRTDGLVPTFEAVRRGGPEPIALAGLFEGSRWAIRGAAAARGVPSALRARLTER